MRRTAAAVVAGLTGTSGGATGVAVVGVEVAVVGVEVEVPPPSEGAPVRSNESRPREAAVPLWVSVACEVRRNGPAPAPMVSDVSAKPVPPASGCSPGR